ncbi:succinyldiaminopimelate transaminase [Helicobacter sp. faydin-H20]|uniref:succinyldiaminopimelate transaminase n=1 Tax=Helicobacter anatolicus TaxID=2905874 RepID=UPI001E5982DD|nr:succinyldiaminopimelate transaminase [Helicobacter anatolicus]MCE3036594.1 succinyldiaminopimelate transaminase [Helicobacter anatolicus]
MEFQPYPFEKIQQLISPIVPKKPVIKLTIGEPQFETPQTIQDTLKQNTQDLRYYPKSKGEEFLHTAIKNFISHRYNIFLDSMNLIPTFGTREVLFNFPQFFLSQFQNPVMAYPNPFYQIYEGASIASKAKTILMHLEAKNHFKPKLTPQEMQQTHLVILNSPNNPTGSTLELKELQQWIEYALEYDFVLLNDECYSEIYQSTPPAGILEASYLMGNKNFKNILSINSISKRLSAPGLRSGYIAGDAKILQSYATYRTYLGCAIPTPLQKAASIAWQSHDEAEKIRKKYAQNLKIAQEIFPNLEISPYTFYLWLEVGNDLEFCKKLYEEEGILVLPGSFLGRENNKKENIGAGYVRIALVYESQILQPALKTLKNFLDKGQY